MCCLCYYNLFMQELCLRWKHHSFSYSTKLMILTQFFSWNSFGVEPKIGHGLGVVKKKTHKRRLLPLLQRDPSFLLSIFLSNSFFFYSINKSKQQGVPPLASTKSSKLMDLCCSSQIRKWGGARCNPPFWRH